MKNITLNADERLIKKAREKAEQEHRSLNVAFREWLSRYVHQNEFSSNYQSLMRDLKYAKAGRKFTREELNER